MLESIAQAVGDTRYDVLRGWKPQPIHELFRGDDFLDAPVVTVTTRFLRRCIGSLRFAFDELNQINSLDPRYHVYCAACVKEFELIAELSGKLLRKHLRPFLAHDRRPDRLVFRDVFRYAAKYLPIGYQRLRAMAIVPRS